jgi:16S rRNA (cytosine967-C5)-methyltransferase
MNARYVAYDILLDFENFKSRLDDLIRIHLSKKKLKPRESKNVYNLAFGVLRYLNTLDWKINKFYNGNYKKALNKLKTILRLAFFEIDYQEFIPPHATVNEYVSMAGILINRKTSGIVNGVLRSYLRQRYRYDPAKSFKYVPSQLSVQYSFPEWMINGWIKDWDEKESKNLCRAFNERPWFTLRINTLVIDEKTFIQKLENSKIEFKPSYYIDHAVKIKDVQTLQRLNFFKKGFCAIQDESSLLVVDLLMPRKGDLILDACVAPGGKYSAILQKSACQARLFGLDPFWPRLQIVRENCTNQKLLPCYIIQGEANNAPFRQKFDKILVDAPCSGIGTIRKHPDIKWRRTQEDIEEFFNLQIQILEGVCNIVKPKGIILYSTCSIQKRENEDVVTTFINNNQKKFNLIEPPPKYSNFIENQYFIRTFPHRHDMDGSFAALIQRSGDYAY